MASHTYLNCCCLSSHKAFWKLCRVYLTSRALARWTRWDRWSADILSAILQVSWEIQDACAFVGCGVLAIPPLDPQRLLPLWSGVVLTLDELDSESAPVGNDSYVALPIHVAPPGSSCGICHGVFPAALHW